jgi:hypothetical protein
MRKKTMKLLVINKPPSHYTQPNLDHLRFEKYISSKNRMLFAGPKPAN